MKGGPTLSEFSVYLKAYCGWSFAWRREGVSACYGPTLLKDLAYKTHFLLIAYASLLISVVSTITAADHRYITPWNKMFFFHESLIRQIYRPSKCGRIKTTGWPRTPNSNEFTTMHRARSFTSHLVCALYILYIKRISLSWKSILYLYSCQVHVYCLMWEEHAGQNFHVGTTVQRIENVSNSYMVDALETRTTSTRK